MRAISTMIVRYESALAYLKLTETYLSHLWLSRAWRAPTGVFTNRFLTHQPVVYFTNDPIGTRF